LLLLLLFTLRHLGTSPAMFVVCLMESSVGAV
jgi:hypothetical protein